MRLLIFLVLFPMMVSAQDTTLTFRVKLPESTVIIEPGHNILWLGQDNLLQIRVEGSPELERVELNGSVIPPTDSGFVATVNQGHEATLSVYERLPNGKVRLATNRQYKVVAKPRPLVKVSGVESDSTILKLTLIAIGRITATYEGLNEKLDVLSFEIELPGKDGKLKTYKSPNDRLTKEMRYAIDELKSGSMVIFKNIKCRTQGGKILKADPVRIFIEHRDVYQYGF